MNVPINGSILCFHRRFSSDHSSFLGEELIRNLIKIKNELIRWWSEGDGDFHGFDTLLSTERVWSCDDW